jgi:hypothetical protein
MASNNSASVAPSSSEQETMSRSKGLPKLEKLKGLWDNSKAILRKPKPTRQERFKGLTRLEKLKELWDTCKSEHEECKYSLTNASDFQDVRENKMANFKVIDVSTNRVVFAPYACRYLALSYVWGNVPLF